MTLRFGVLANKIYAITRKEATKRAHMRIKSSLLKADVFMPHTQPLLDLQNYSWKNLNVRLS